MPNLFLPKLSRVLAAFILTIACARADVFYVTDSGADVITRINQAGSTSSYPAPPTGLSDPQQVVFDSAGNSYVADSGLGKVMMIPAGGGAAVQIGNDVAGVNCLAFSPTGVLHVASGTDDTIRRLANNDFGGAVATLPGSATIRSIAFEKKTGDLYVADTAGNRIFRIDPQGGQSTFATGTAVTAPFCVAFDSTDKLHITDAGENGRILAVRGNGNSSKFDTVAKTLGDVRGLAFDRADAAHFLTGNGELRRVTGGTSSVLIAENLGTVQLLTARAASLTPVAHKGMILSSGEDGATAAIGTLGSPAIGNGQVAFKAVLASAVTGPAVSAANSLALYREGTGGTLELLARKSAPAPGMTVGTTAPILNSFADPIVNNAGKIAFVGTLRAGLASVTSADAIAIFSDYDGAGLRPVLRRGQGNLGNQFDAAVKFTTFKQLVLPDDAGPAVIATIAGPGVLASSSLGLWSVDISGNLSMVLRTGTELMVGGKVRKLSGMTIFTPTPLSLGQARHFGSNQTFTLIGTFSDGFKAILRVQAGASPQVLVEKGAEVGPGSPPLPTLASFGSPATADFPTFAFRGVLKPVTGAVTAATAPVIVVNDVTNVKLARAGDATPDVVNGAFASLSDPVVSPSGSVAFLGKLRVITGVATASTAAGLWQDLGDGLHLAVRQGDPSPGVPTAAKFTSFKQFVLPETGGVVFTAMIAGDGITSANNLGLWANDGAGATELLLRKGDKLTVGGKVRTMTAFKVFTAALGVTGQSRHFDADGTIACNVTCSDGTQAILSIERP